MGTHSIALTKAKQNLGQLANRAAYGGDRFILEFRGKPRAALVSYEDLERLRAMDGTPRSQKEVLERADELRKEIAATGEVFDSVSDVRRLRRERDEQISGLR